MTLTFADRPRFWTAIAVGTAIAGTLDMAGACVQSYVLRGTSPITIMQSVGSGLLGNDAFQGGIGTALVGLAAHYVIIAVATALLWFAARRVRFITDQPWIAGPLYGLMVFAFMNYVVVPLSRAPFELKYTATSLVLQLFYHLFFVGLVLALVVRRYAR